MYTLYGITFLVAHDPKDHSSPAFQWFHFFLAAAYDTYLFEILYWKAVAQDQNKSWRATKAAASSFAVIVLT